MKRQCVVRSNCSFIDRQEEVRQARFIDGNRCNEGKAESATGAMQRSGQAADREDIKRQAGSKQRNTLGETLGNVRRG